MSARKPSLPAAGFALVAVVWLVAALSLLALSVVAATRGELRAVAADRDFIEAEVLGDAAIEVAVRALRFADERPEEGLEFSYDLEGREIVVRARPVEAFLDLNHASQELLQALFAHAAGLDEKQAETLAQRVLDWRDGDDEPLPLGAEDEAYEAAGVAYRTRGGNFHVKEDLLQVLGVDFDVYDRIRKFVTTFGEGGGVSARAAPAAVLRILAEGDDERVASFLAARDDDPTTLDMTAFRSEFLGSGSQTRYRMAAILARPEGPALVRVRWVDLEREGTAGRPWHSLAAEAVRAVDEDSDGG